MIPGKWFYFSLSVTSQGEGVLSLWDRNGLVLSDSSSNFQFVQTLKQGWNVCFGLCDAESNGYETGFSGGIREVLAISEWQSQEQIQNEANRI